MAQEDSENQKQQEQEYSEKKPFYKDPKTLRKLSVVGSIMVLICIGYMVYYQFIWKPKNQESKTVYWHASTYLEKDSLTKAINGDSRYPGYLSIANNYSNTIGGEVAEYAVGVAYLNTGQYKNAATYLAKVDLEDEMVSTMAIGALGDAYWELGQTGEALKHYEKAIKNKPNQFTTPYFLMKAGRLLEKVGRPEDALSKYKKIKKDWPESNESEEIEKYIAHLGG